MNCILTFINISERLLYVVSLIYFNKLQIFFPERKKADSLRSSHNGLQHHCCQRSFVVLCMCVSVCVFKEIA